MKKFYAIMLAVGFLTMGAFEANGSATGEQPAPPQFMKLPPKTCVVTVGENAYISCEISGVPTCSVKVLFNGREITSSEHYDISFENNRITLVIFEVHFSDAGVYTFVITNEIGEAQASTELIVEDIE